MAPTLTIQPPLTNRTTNHNPKLPRACFSFAAYAKAVIHHLATTSNVAVEPGLAAAEFTALESTFHFTFPPDLKSILQEGLPVGPGFPNWRSSSAQQLQILTTLPLLGLSKEVSLNNFWAQSWGPKPKRTVWLLKESPVLVPIYRNCYIPCAPSLAGNPVFYVDGGDVRVWSFDIAGFFQRFDFENSAKPIVLIKNGKQEHKTRLLTAPAWAAREARRVEFWTEVAARGGTRRRVEYARWRLREGGWKEEEVGEMMDGGEEEEGKINGLRDVVGHVRELSGVLLRADWSTEDVVDSLGSYEVEV